MAKLWRNFCRFFRDCLDALTEDDKAAERRAYEAQLAHKRWIDFLSNPRH